VAFTPRTYGKPEVPETTVGLATRGGGDVLAMLPVSSLAYSRRLDDMGDCTVTVATGDCTDALGVVLTDVNPWEHELVVWRGTSQVWVGPVNEVRWSTGGVSIRARDLFQWAEHRQLAAGTHLDRTADLAVIFAEWAVNGFMSTDNSMHVEIRVADCGVSGTREVDNLDYRYTSDELRELARTAVDWTMVGRELWAGGEDFIADITGGVHTFWDEFGVPDFAATVTGDDLPVSPTAPFITEHVDAPEIVKPPGVSYVVVRGTATTVDTAQPIGTAGGTNATLGRVDLIESDMSIRDTTSAATAASNRLALVGDETMTCRWLVDSSVRFHHLIPGVRIPVAVQTGCRLIDEDMLLVSVDVSVQGGDEVVVLRLGPVLD
jgi:hypothetical protein